MSAIEESVINKIRFRATVGELKYGVTMERDDLSLLQWMIHKQEEMLDDVIYTEKIIQMLRAEDERLGNGG
jgi:hypothetical protein